MKATELRIGNLIFDNISEEPIIVDWVTIKVCYLEDDVYEPILLTEEWLIKFGFETDGITFWKSKADIGHFKDCFAYIPCGLASQRRTEIKYVHQLQNLYFALTGEELTIK